MVLNENHLLFFCDVRRRGCLKIVFNTTPGSGLVYFRENLLYKSKHVYIINYNYCCADKQMPRQ